MSYDNAQARLEDGALPFRALGGVGSADRVVDGVADRGDRDFVESLARGLAVIQAFTNQQHQLSIATPLIVKYRDEKTDAGTALEDALR